jgi:Tol biopolymer transport system component
MPRQLRIIAKHPFGTNYILLSSLLFLLSCAPQAQPPTQTTLFVYRYDPPAFVEISEDLQPINEIPFAVPPNCGLFDVFPAPVGKYLLIELSCPNGQTVLFLNTLSSPNASAGPIMQPITDSDSHFLAWTSDGRSAYLKVDSLGNARVLRVDTNGMRKEMDVSGWTYDLASKPGSDDFIFTFSGGLGSGSELNFTQNNGRAVTTLYKDPYNYISFARYSPDGSQIAFIKIPDSPTPFTVGELWIIPSTADFATSVSSSAQGGKYLADVDAGHGYAANWSPDGTRIAFVKRENPQDQSANQSAGSLISNVYVVNVESGELTQVTHLTTGHVETPHWSIDGNTLAFNVVLDDRMEVQIAEMSSGQIQSLITESACCPAWMRK